jgi:phosphoenolpyruvate carboxykinase (ATP)
MARKDEITTCYGSACYITKVRNRSAKQSYIVSGQVPVGVRQPVIEAETAAGVVGRVHSYLSDKTVIRLDRSLCANPEARINCRLYITAEYARIPYMWHDTLFPAPAVGSPDVVSVYVPEWPERMILIYPADRVTYILGTDYFGECKKSFLRMAMYIAKQRGWLGFHAGSKVVRVEDGDGSTREVGFIMFGLSGTGKTTLTMHDHGLAYPEGVAIRQDDVVLMRSDGYCYGTENGFFFKTEGLEPSQTVLWNAATRADAILENVKVGEDGSVDFLDCSLTSNGRGVVARANVAHTDGTCDLRRADKIVFITRRNDIVPPVAKLDPERAAAFFMLGESIETSAGDPSRAGQSKREVGTNPFIVGPEHEEGNTLLEFLRASPQIESFLLNTGAVGENTGFKGRKITVGDSTHIMLQIARGGIAWKRDPDWGYLVPEAVEGMDAEAYDPRRYYSAAEYRDRTEKLRKERIAWLAQFPGLRSEIVRSIECR